MGCSSSRTSAVDNLKVVVPRQPEVTSTTTTTPSCTTMPSADRFDKILSPQTPPPLDKPQTLSRKRTPPPSKEVELDPFPTTAVDVASPLQPPHPTQQHQHDQRQHQHADVSRGRAPNPNHTHNRPHRASILTLVPYDEGKDTFGLWQAPSPSSPPGQTPSAPTTPQENAQIIPLEHSHLSRSRSLGRSQLSFEASTRTGSSVYLSHYSTQTITSGAQRQRRHSYQQYLGASSNSHAANTPSQRSTQHMPRSPRPLSRAEAGNQEERTHRSWSLLLWLDGLPPDPVPSESRELGGTGCDIPLSSDALRMNSQRIDLMVYGIM